MASVECLPTGQLGDSTRKPWKPKLIVDQCLNSMPIMDEAALRQQQKFQEDSLWVCSASAIFRNGRHVMMMMMMMKPRNMASSHCHDELTVGRGFEVESVGVEVP